MRLDQNLNSKFKKKPLSDAGAKIKFRAYSKVVYTILLKFWHILTAEKSKAM